MTPSLMADLLVQVYSDAAGETIRAPQSAVVHLDQSRGHRLDANRDGDGRGGTRAGHPGTQRAGRSSTGRADLLAPIAPVPREVIVPVEPARREELEGMAERICAGVR